MSMKSIHPALQILGDWGVLAPFVACNLVLWIGAHGVERVLRRGTDVSVSSDADGGHHGLGAYLDFQFRHQFLVVAVPLSLILFSSNLTEGYATQLIEWTRWPFTPDVVLGVAASVVFVCSPLLLRRIWRTERLEPGPLRDRLEALCQKIGLRVREILIWRSDGLMVNAAVMGLFAPVRFVLLSDALLKSMTTEQIEAVFGHEAGHVRHRHIPHFLVFAFVGWLIVAGMMEVLARTWTDAAGQLTVSALVIQGVGVGATVIFWTLGFGWLSRRFEWQADLFGASCVTPADGDCRQPCSLHLDDAVTTAIDPTDRVCATGAAIFASALRRVAVLNGIPTEERSWRHSSIGNRIRFLASVSGDPGRAVRFQRRVRRTKRMMMAMAVIGGAMSVAYVLFRIAEWRGGT
jgi:STE24 endopeptidase